MQRVYIAESLIDGQLVVDQLAAENIDSEIFHQNIQGGLGELAVVYPEVWIKRDRDFTLAKKLVEAFVQQPNPETTRNCKQCGEISPDTFDFCWQCHTTLTV